MTRPYEPDGQTLAFLRWHLLRERRRRRLITALALAAGIAIGRTTR